MPRPDYRQILDYRDLRTAQFFSYRSFTGPITNTARIFVDTARVWSAGGWVNNPYFNDVALNDFLNGICVYIKTCVRLQSSINTRVGDYQFIFFYRGTFGVFPGTPDARVLGAGCDYMLERDDGGVPQNKHHTIIMYEQFIDCFGRDLTVGYWDVPVPFGQSEDGFSFTTVKYIPYSMREKI